MEAVTAEIFNHLLTKFLLKFIVLTLTSYILYNKRLSYPKKDFRKF
jgi:hypothetical protein